MHFSAFTPPPSQPLTASHSLHSRGHTTAATISSTSLPSTTGSTAPYGILADAHHRAPGSILGGVDDISASRSPSAAGAAADAGAVPLDSSPRAAAASRKTPRLLQSHSMVSMLLASGDLLPCEQPVHLAAPSSSAETAMSTASATSSSSVSDDEGPTIFFPILPPPSPGPQQRGLRKPRCIRLSGVPYIEQTQQRCRTATALTQHLVTPSRSPRVSGASASSPLHHAAVVLRQPRNSLLASLPPASSPRVSHSEDPVRALGQHLPVEPLSSETHQLHWSMRGKAPVVNSAGSHADGRRSPGASGAALIQNFSGGQQEASNRSVSTLWAGLGELPEHSIEDYGSTMDAGDSALHCVALSTRPRSPAALPPSVDNETSPSLVTSAGIGVQADAASEPAHLTRSSFFDVRPSGGLRRFQAPRRRRSDVGSFYWAERVFVGHPLSRSSAMTAGGVGRPPGDGGAPAAATAAQHAQTSNSLTIRSHESDVPSPSLSPWHSMPQTHSYLSPPSSAAGTGAAPLLRSVTPDSSLTLSQQQPHTSLLAISLTAPGASSPSSPSGATAGIPAAGGGGSSTLPLVFTVMEPTNADVHTTSGGGQPSQEAQPISLPPSASSPSSHRSYNDHRDDSLERALIFQQHPFSTPLATAPATVTRLPPSRTASLHGSRGGSHGRIAHTDFAAATLRAAADIAVVGERMHHCARRPRGRPPEGLVEAAISPPRSSGFLHQPPPALLVGTAEVECRPNVQPLLTSLPAASPVCETPPHRQQQPPVGRHCATEDAPAGHPAPGVGGTVKAAAEAMPLPSADSAVLLVVPGGVSSVPAAAIAAITSFAASAPSWGSGAPADAALALIDDVIEGGPCEEGRLVATGRRLSGGGGGSGSAKYATKKVITYFPVHKAILAQRSAYFAALLDQGGGCGPYVRSTPDEYVDLAELPALASAGASSQTDLRRSGGVGASCPMTTKPLHISRCLAHLSGASAAVSDTFNALNDTEGIHSATTSGVQRVPVYSIPTPATVGRFDDESGCARLGGDEVYSRTRAGDSAAAVPLPTFSQACVSQLIHYLYTGVLPIFYQLPERTEFRGRELTEAAGITPQSGPLRDHVANEYAALLWMGFYTGLSSLTSSMLKLLWHLLALSRNVWPYWMAAVHWHVPEMQFICEAWIGQHLCTMLRAPSTQGLWQGLRLDQVQLLVRLRKEALETEGRAAQTSPTARGAPPRYLSGRTTTSREAAAESSATSPIATMLSRLWKQISSSDTATSAGGHGAANEGPTEQLDEGLPLRPSAPAVATMRWPAVVLGCQQLHPLRLRGGSSGSCVGAHRVSSSGSSAAYASAADNHRVSPVSEGTANLNRAAAGSLPPPLVPQPALAFSTPPPALDSVPFPADTPARAKAAALRTELRQSQLTTRDLHYFSSEVRAEPRSLSRGLYAMHSANASSTTTLHRLVTQPTLQLLEDGAWEVGGCGRLYTAETREELEQLQAYWYKAEWVQQQQQHSSAVLLTGTEVVERLWTWWRARAADSPNQLPEAEVQVVAEMMRDALLSSA
ncbi:hypothetical protein LSCM1_05577 [Leishmania martiniquensis]|uniref:BTB domain-containing protein n=1 Tax=Leishmania martiniquensis TaxID=1580590 RepID=A0A836HRE4_9TRYP|nr:hypothetical protein LSCM1_05577 [Leishmania martiniquensis]